MFSTVIHLCTVIQLTFLICHVHMVICVILMDSIDCKQKQFVHICIEENKGKEKYLLVFLINTDLYF